MPKEDKEQLIIEKLDKLINLLEPIITKNGLLISGQGMIANNTDAMIEKLDKIQKFLYFLEKRQLAWKQEFEKVNQLPIEQNKSNQ